MRPKYTKHMPLQEVWVFPVALVIKNLPVIAEDVRDISSIPGSGRSPGGGHGNPLLYSCLENPVDRGVGRTTVHGVTKSWTWLKCLSMRACRGGSLQASLVAQTVKRLPTMRVDSGLIPGSGRSSGQGNGNPLQFSCLENPMDGWSLVGYSLWGHKESDMTERLH